MAVTPNYHNLDALGCISAVHQEFIIQHVMDNDHYSGCAMDWKLGTTPYFVPRFINLSVKRIFLFFEYHIVRNEKKHYTCKFVFFSTKFPVSYIGWFTVIFKKVNNSLYLETRAHKSFPPSLINSNSLRFEKYFTDFQRNSEKKKS